MQRKLTGIWEWKSLGDKAAIERWKQMKERIKKEYFHRIERILKIQLNAKKKIFAIKSLAIPVMSYSYGVVEWLRFHLQKIDRKTRKLLTLVHIIQMLIDYTLMEQMEEEVLSVLKTRLEIQFLTWMFMTK